MGEEHCYSRSTLDRWIAAYQREGPAGRSPLGWADKGNGRVSPELMAEAVRLRRAVPTRSAALRWSVTRRVTKTATVSLFANRYGVEPFLIGRAVELCFDPEDLAVIDVVLSGQVICQAVPYSIGRHVHPAVPQARPQKSQEEEGPGIDYLGLVRIAEEQAQGSGQIAYREVPLPGFVVKDSESGAMGAPGGLWAAHFGFTRTPFSKSVPADKLFARSAHDETVDRIQYCIAESALGVITGEVGAGKSVAVRAAVAGLDRTATPLSISPTPREAAADCTWRSRPPSGRRPGSTRQHESIGLGGRWTGGCSCSRSGGGGQGYSAGGQRAAPRSREMPCAAVITSSASTGVRVLSNRRSCEPAIPIAPQATPRRLKIAAATPPSPRRASSCSRAWRLLLTESRSCWTAAWSVRVWALSLGGTRCSSKKLFSDSGGM